MAEPPHGSSPGQLPGGHPAYAYPPPGWPAPPPDPVVPTSLGGWFDSWMRVFRRSFWRLSLIALIVGGVLLVLVGGCLWVIYLVTGPTATGATSDPPVAVVVVSLTTVFLVVFAAFMVGQAASTYLAVMDAAGRPATISDALRLGARRALPLFGWSLLAAAAVTIGIVLLVVPGIYLAVVFNASLACVVVIERDGIGRCLELIKNRFWATFGRLLLGWLVVEAYRFVAQLVLLLVFAALFALMVPDQTAGPGVAATIYLSLFGIVALAVLVLPAVVASTAITVVTYGELRGHENPSTTTERLADELAGP